jgi:hypothetical protein
MIRIQPPLSGVPVQSLTANASKTTREHFDDFGQIPRSLFLRRNHWEIERVIASAVGVLQRCEELRILTHVQRAAVTNVPTPIGQPGYRAVRERACESNDRTDRDIIVIGHPTSEVMGDLCDVNRSNGLIRFLRFKEQRPGTSQLTSRYLQAAVAVHCDAIMPVMLRFHRCRARGQPVTQSQPALVPEGLKRRGKRSGCSIDSTDRSTSRSGQ